MVPYDDPARLTYFVAVVRTYVSIPPHALCRTTYDPLRPHRSTYLCCRAIIIKFSGRRSKSIPEQQEVSVLQLVF